MHVQELEHTARAMVAEGKGILAMDESNSTCGKRFKSVGVENTEPNRRAYRELLLTTPGLGEFISGAILYDETLRQSSKEGTPFPEVMKRQGIMPGIKVDTGAKNLAGFPGEKVTEGLDGLRERFEEYRGMGARFAKWRAVITIGEGLPTQACLKANAHALARYAALAQEAGLVPIVEPEVLMDGDHTIERCYAATSDTLQTVFYELYEQRIALEGMILKASMVLPASDCPHQVSVEKVAEETLRCLLHVVPPAIPGIAFLSGGQSDETATAHLNAMNVKAKDMSLPWQLSFSYARALQQQALKTWQGNPDKISEAQTALYHRAKCNGAARSGRYTEEMEQLAA